MTNLMKMAGLGFIPFLLVACQKEPSSNSPQSQPQVLLQQDSLSIDCGSLSQNEIRNARLVGPETVTQNKAATFSLAGVANCGAHQKLLTFTQPGTFQVSASLKTDSQTVQLTAITQVVGISLELTGPVIGVEGLPLVFSLSNPDNLVITSLAWDFGDGSASTSGTSVTTIYNMPGSYVVAAVATFEDGSSKQVTHPITVVPLEDPFLCVKGFAVVSPATGVAGQAIDMSVFLPPCLQGQVTHVAWNFGDASSGNGLSVSHTYNQEGIYDLIVSVFHPNTDVLWFNYPVQINISAASIPSTTTTTLPAVCVEGATRDKLEPIVSKTLQCGVNGQQTTDSQVTITEQCQRVDGVLGYVEVSRKTQVVKVGLCEGQSCQLPDGTFLQHGDSRLMYSSQLPASSCTSVSQVRNCQNGVLMGTSSFSHLNCTNGCENFGPSGTVKTAVVTGQTQVALTCQHGETGFFDLFNQVADQTCQSGTIATSNSRLGDLITKGQCPVYSWTGTEEYTACTAACGGTQARVYQCQDAAGQLALPERCGQLTAESRACDGDPAQVRRVETSTTTEEANSSAVCPKTQIGVIVNQREVTVTKTFACIDHSVQLESSVNTAAPWVEERYCRDYVANRCSQDSLNNEEAKKRLQWMVGCADQVPVIKEFLEHFASVTVDGKDYSLTSNGRVLYPTFMNRVGKVTKPWIAPKGGVRDSSQCAVPNTAFVAAVCVSSCATPEEQIIAQEVASGKLAGVTFIEALTKNYQFVGTLASHSGMSSRQLKKTKVDQWVTEMLDSEHEILEFRTVSGGSLKVTPNHPLVSDEGKMKLAVDFKVGESLVKLGGVKDEIVSINQVPYFGKVYNLFVKSADPIKNVVVTNGYLNGTAFYQNEGSKHLNRVVFRKRVTQGVFE